jgi:hypothetical protein
VKEANSAALVRLAWSKTPFSVELIARVETAADPSSLVVRRGAAGAVHAAYSPDSNTVVVLRDGREAARVSADQGAFAFLLEPGDKPSWVVRRSGILIYERQGSSGIEREELGVTDALPLAAIRDSDNRLMVALANPYGAALVTSFGKDSRWTGTLAPRCSSGQLSGAHFRTPSVLTLACD